MLSSPIILFAALASIAAALPALESRATSYQIRSVSDPIYHLYLQSLPSSPSTPVLGPEASGDNFTIAGSIQSVTTGKYLNLEKASTSYLPLTFAATSNTTAWGLEGDTIITTTGSSYGRQLNFLACEAATTGYYNIYLQTGSDVPAGRTCSNYQTLHLPCLC